MRARVGVGASLLASLAVALGPRVAAAQTAPWLLSPRSGGCALSATPSLRWRGASRAAPSRVRLCRDRGCATTLLEFDAFGGAATTPRALPPGVVFWRVESGGHASATWSFTVTARPSAHDVVAPRCTDLDGDGHGDALIAQLTRAHRINLLWGSPRGLVRRGAQRLVEPPTRYGLSVAPAGDLDGDGYADVVAYSYDVPSRPGGRVSIADPAGAVLVYRGGRGGVQARASVRLGPRAGEEAFGAELRLAGDTDGDGRGDLLVSAAPSGRTAGPRGSCLQLRRRIFDAAGATASDVALDGLRCDVGGRSFSAAGDGDGDGFGDVVVARGARGDEAAAVRLYHGSAEGLTRAEDLDLSTVRVPSGATVELAELGDVDGDGFADFSLAWERTASAPAQVTVWRGAAAGPLTPHLLRPPSRGEADDFGRGVGAVGDLDNDGRDEVMLSVSDRTVALLRNGAIDAPTLFSRGTGLPTEFFGGSHDSCGDVDGDGFTDVLVGTTCAETDAESGDACLVREYHLFRGGRDALSESRRDAVNVPGPR